MLYLLNPEPKLTINITIIKFSDKGLLLDIQTRCGRHNWTLQQDRAPSHTARNTINFLHQVNIAFTEPNRWPRNSPDLNPVDYAIWGALQEKFTFGENLTPLISSRWQ